MSHVELVEASCPLCPNGTERTPLATGRDYEYGVTGDQPFRFVRCTGCGIVLLDPRPVDAAIAGLYPPDYEPYRFDALPAPVRAARDRVQRGKVRALEAVVGGRARVVDVGCGSGALLRLFARFGPPGWELLGWDFPGPHLDRLRDDGFQVLDAPVEATAAPEADAFVLNQVIEHFPHPEVLLDGLAAALRPGGILFIETPNTNGLDARLFAGGHWGGYHIPRHLVLFDTGNLAVLVRRSGLHVLRQERLASPAFWLQSVHHRLVDRGHPRLARLSSLKNPIAVAIAAAWDWLRPGPTSNQRLIARKPSEGSAASD